MSAFFAINAIYSTYTQVTSRIGFLHFQIKIRFYCSCIAQLIGGKLLHQQLYSTKIRESLLSRTQFFTSLLPIGITSLILIGCSGLEQSEKEKIRRRNCKAELIYRNKGDSFYLIAHPEHMPRSLYPWEADAYLPRITCEYFRCKGSRRNLPKTSLSNPDPIVDCEGSSGHGLPIIQKKEGVYPILLDLLNYLQKKTGKRVIVTCGHRCPIHNRYSDPSKENRISKHQIGAEVDFYIQGMESQPLEVANLLMEFYHEMGSNQDNELTEFKRYEGSDTKTVLKPWINKEIFIKIYQKEEGRDDDNSHPYPYIAIQVRFDRDLKKRVTYDWETAHKGYPKK